MNVSQFWTLTPPQFHSHSKPKPKPVLSPKPDQLPVLVHWATTETFVLSQGRQRYSQRQMLSF